MAYEPDTNLRKLRKNGQVVQPNIEYVPDNNGWPEPLTDPSDPYKINVTNGKNGESRMNDGIGTSQKSTGGWSLAEGQSSAIASQPSGDLSGQRAGDETTSQKIWSDPGGGGAKGKNPDIDGDTATRSSNPLETSQQALSGHKTAEGD